MQDTIKCGVSAAVGSLLTILLLWFAGATTRASTASPPAQGKTPKSDVTSAAPQQGGTNVVVDDATAAASYANFARVTATPEEVIVDFALNPQPFATGEQHVKVSQRLVLNFYTTKRLLGALQSTLERHESAFGPIELDVRKRAKSNKAD